MAKMFKRFKATITQTQTQTQTQTCFCTRWMALAPLPVGHTYIHVRAIEDYDNQI